jgi:hypothetical protein
MEPTREILNKYSKTRLQSLARSKNLSANGNKAELVQRILGTRSNKKEEKVSKPSAKENKKEYFPLDKLPLDVQSTAALNLSYKDILNLYRSNKKLAGICKDPEFWRKKILRDFKEEINQKELDKLKPNPGDQEGEYRNKLLERYRAKYEDLYANKLEQEGKDYFNKHKQNKEWKKYNTEFYKVEDKIKHLLQEMKKLMTEQQEILTKQLDIENKYKNTGNNLQKQAEAIRKKNEKVLPQEYQYKYLDIRIPPEAIEDY